MIAVKVKEKSKNSDTLKYELVKDEIPKINKEECLIKIHASSVNPSDVKGLLGKMPNLIWPRTPGRDYAGIVVEGPSRLIGKEVWGTGGDLGMSRNGAHAEFIIVNINGINEKPKNLSMVEAGSLGVSWTCAWLGMVEGANVLKGETVVVFGANGKVGEASIQIASAVGARVIAVERNNNNYLGHASGAVEVISCAQEPDILDVLMDKTNGKGADIIMNTVGSPYFEVGCNSMAKNGRHIIITTIIEENMINLRTFYRGNFKMLGISNMDHDHIVSSQLLEDMKSGFDNGTYKPFPIIPENIYSLNKIELAYKTVLKNLSRNRIVINPEVNP
ncbi:MAG: oxidoreductase [Rhodospirillaceae bacterium]|nr:oxidoreductase [Rhodospirillaceae bacterium]OUT77178.1 MAG: hypothetical protein CBB83_08250 [Rhodospirillaceae bacterium TMED23]|tara:strand:+ start:806 stop:1801 length:996 start_codon:yes stop_codon:yes gene_type:complete